MNGSLSVLHPCILKSRNKETTAQSHCYHMLSKLLEKHMRNLLVDHLQELHPLSTQQWGFTQGKSTTGALLLLLAQTSQLRTLYLCCIFQLYQSIWHNPLTSSYYKSASLQISHPVRLLCISYSKLKGEKKNTKNSRTLMSTLTSWDVPNLYTSVSLC